MKFTRPPMQRDAGDLPPADHGSVRADQVDPAHGLLPHLHQPPHEDMEVTQFSSVDCTLLSSCLGLYLWFGI